MPQPNINSVHVDAILTNISIAYLQNQDNFIADKVFPVIPVDKKSDKYFSYTKNDWFRDEAQRRAPGTESAGGGYNLSTGTYSADVYAFHKDVDDQTVANADAPLNPLREATEFVTRRMMLRKELQFVTDFFTTGVWADDVDGVSGTPGHQAKQSNGLITLHLTQSQTLKQERLKFLEIQEWKRTLLFLDTMYSSHSRITLTW
jgi:hypothetical protein